MSKLKIKKDAVITSKTSLVLPALISIIYASSVILYSLGLSKIIDSLSNNNFNDARTYLYHLILIFAVQALFFFLKTFSENRWARNQLINIRTNVVKHWSYSNYENFTSKTLGEYTSFFIKEIDILENQYFRSIMSLISSVPMLILVIASLWFIHPFFILLLVFLVVICLAVIMYLSSKMETANSVYAKDLEKTNNSVEEFYHGFGIMKIFGLKEKIMNVLENQIISQEEDAEKRQNLGQIANGIIVVAMLGMNIAGFVLGISLIKTGRLTLGLMFASIEIVTNAFEPIAKIAGSLTQIKACKSIIEKYKKITLVSESEDKQDLHNSFLELHMKGLSYAYPGVDSKILNNLTLCIEPGKKYALVGANGSGKSTLLKVMSGLNSSYNGTFKVSGQDLEEINQESYYKHISIIPQDCFVFSDGIKNNFENIPERQILECFEHFDISYLSEKEWKNLSGGERQKISIIRALTKDASIILADEPTSALDEESKETFWKIFNKSEKTWIVVTHSQNGLEYFDENISL